MTASRKEVTEEFDRYVQAVDALMAGPAWSADSLRVDAIVARWREPSHLSRLWPLAVASPVFPGTRDQLEQHLARRDGLLIGLALELYRQKNGHYPEALAVLSPDYLPTLPVDRLNGGPLRYRLVDGKPIVYSIGADGDDDGGKIPVKRFTEGVQDPLLAARWRQNPKLAADGDWVIHPLHREPADESAAAPDPRFR